MFLIADTPYPTCDFCYILSIVLGFVLFFRFATLCFSIISQYLFYLLLCGSTLHANICPKQCCKGWCMQIKFQPNSRSHDESSIPASNALWAFVLLKTLHSTLQLRVKLVTCLFKLPDHCCSQCFVWEEVSLYPVASCWSQYCLMQPV